MACCKILYACLFDPFSRLSLGQASHSSGLSGTTFYLFLFSYILLVSSNKHEMRFCCVIPPLNVHKNQKLLLIYTSLWFFKPSSAVVGSYF